MKSLIILIFFLVSSVACKPTSERKSSKTQTSAAQNTIDVNTYYPGIDSTLRAQIDAFVQSNQLSQLEYADLLALAKANPEAARQLIGAVAQTIPNTPPSYEPPAWLAWLEDSPFSFILDWTRKLGGKLFPFL